MCSVNLDFSSITFLILMLVILLKNYHEHDMKCGAVVVQMNVIEMMSSITDIINKKIIIINERKFI